MPRQDILDKDGETSLLPNLRALAANGRVAFAQFETEFPPVEEFEEPYANLATVAVSPRIAAGWGGGGGWNMECGGVAGTCSLPPLPSLPLPHPSQTDGHLGGSRPRRGSQHTRPQLVPRAARPFVVSSRVLPPLSAFLFFEFLLFLCSLLSPSSPCFVSLVWCLFVYRVNVCCRLCGGKTPQ